MDEFPYDTLSALARTCRQFADAVEVLARTRLALFARVLAGWFGVPREPRPQLIPWLSKLRRVLQPDWSDDKLGPSAVPSALPIIGFMGLCIARFLTRGLGNALAHPHLDMVIYYDHSLRREVDTAFDYVSWCRRWPCSVVVGYAPKSFVAIIGDIGPLFAVDYTGFYRNKEEVERHMASPSFARAPSRPGA
jgi:hypothetical protein